MKLFLAAAALALLICFSPMLLSKKVDTEVVFAAYSWKTTYYYSSVQDSLLKKNNFKRMYVKIMDIDWSPVYNAYPTTSTDITYELESHPNFEFVPVVFITNETMRYADSAAIKVLSEKLILKSKQLCRNLDGINEVQIDCDWSKSTRDKYFYLLTLLKDSLQDKTLSATIRLHQYKHKELCGVPPIDKGMLMLYNMGRISDYNETNSIFNYNEALKYINGAGVYPLPLDAALPCFNWGIIFRKKQFYDIAHTVSREYLDTCKSFAKLPNGNYQVIASYWDNEYTSYMSYGDELRLEEITSEDLIKASQLVNKIKNQDTMYVSFFELNSSTLTTLDRLTYEKIRTTIK